MIIIISGLPGAGKSSVAKRIAKKLGYKHYSTGDIQREIANEKGLTIAQLGELEAEDKSIDLMIDNKTKQIVNEKDKIVMDSWLAPNFVNDAFCVFLKCDMDERARRRLKHKRKEESFDSIQETKKNMQKRTKTNRERWIRYYDYDFLDMNNYNLVVDTTNISVEEVVQQIMEKI